MLAPIVRTASVGDLVAVSKVDQAAFPDEPYPAYVLRQLLDISDSLFLVAEDAINPSTVSGYVVGTLATDRVTGWVLTLAVRPESRNRGIGGRLMRSVLEGLTNCGCEVALLTVAPENRQARRLYEHMGFRVLVVDDEYFGQSAPRILMAQPLAV